MSPARPLPEKHCRVCGRRMTWRKKWADSWDEVRHCSRRCRARGLSPADRFLEEAVVRLLETRPGSSSLCPSEAARQVAPERWRSLMEAAREAARRLAARGVVSFTQGGRSVDPSTARGALRIARGPRWAARRERGDG